MAPPPLVLPRQRYPSFGTPVRWDNPPPVNSGVGSRNQPQVDPRRRAADPSGDRGSWRRDPPSTASRPRSNGDTYSGGDSRGERRNPPPSDARPRSNRGSASSGGDNRGERRGPPPSETRL